ADDDDLVIHCAPHRVDILPAQRRPCASLRPWQRGAGSLAACTYAQHSAAATMCGMALHLLDPPDLAPPPPVLADFMGRNSARRRTMAERVEVYRQQSPMLSPADDRDDHLRVQRFIEDMAARRWRAGVVVRIGVFDGTVLIIDGIHRGVAYLG